MLYTRRRKAARVFGLGRVTIAKMCRYSAPPGLCAVQSSGGHTKSGKSTALALYGKAKRCPRSEWSLDEAKRRLTPRLGACCYWRIAHEFPSGIRVGLVHESDTPPFANRNEVS
jgi:hypothetical protein